MVRHAPNERRAPQPCDPHLERLTRTSFASSLDLGTDPSSRSQIRTYPPEYAHKNDFCPLSSRFSPSLHRCRSKGRLRTRILHSPPTLKPAARTNAVPKIRINLLGPHPGTHGESGAKALRESAPGTQSPGRAGGAGHVCFRAFYSEAGELCLRELLGFTGLLRSRNGMLKGGGSAISSSDD